MKAYAWQLVAIAVGAFLGGLVGNGGLIPLWRFVLDSLHDWRLRRKMRPAGIQCRICVRKPSDPPGDVHLIRMNEKGVRGVWECATGTGCCKLPCICGTIFEINGPCQAREHVRPSSRCVQ